MTGTKYAEGVKKYLDYLWEIKWDENDLDLSDDLFDTTNDPDIPAVKYPNITSYFEKELVNSYVDGHDNFLQADDRLYVNIGGGSNSGEYEWYKEVLESIGINDTKYVIYNKQYRF